jgi:hypothetical protein
MFNLGLGELSVLALLALIFLVMGRPTKLPALAQRFRRRRGRNGFVRPTHEVVPLDRLDWALLGTGFALLFAVAALLARR